jgi:hypothetical protein
MKALRPELNDLARQWIEELIAKGANEVDVAAAINRSQPVVSRIRDGAGTTLDVLQSLAWATGRGEDFAEAVAAFADPKVKGVGVLRFKEPPPKQLPGAPTEGRSTERGRWRRYAMHAEYGEFRREAELAHDAGVPDIVLDVASDELGLRKGQGPSREETQAAIERAMADQRDARQRYGRPPAERVIGREATAEDFQPPPVVEKPKRKR